MDKNENPQKGSDPLPPCAVLPAATCSAINMTRFIECLPADVRKKLSLHDIKRVCDNYRKPPCGECHLKPGETCDICGATEKPNAMMSHSPEK